MAAIALHVLSGVFWAGSTFVLARSGGIGAERLAYPQVVAVLGGIVLWGLRGLLILQAWQATFHDITAPIDLGCYRK
jgi:hypothetical protein